MPGRPVLSSVPPSRGKKPAALVPDEPKRFTFSFRFWRQREFFGLEKARIGWVAALLERLCDLSKERIDEVLSDRGKKDWWRIHEIDWCAEGIPIKRSDLDWLPEDFREDTDDYPFLQFQISKALGRVIGFLDDENVFNVVLLDPHHNMQPSKDFDYKVTWCQPAIADYPSLLADVAEAKQVACVQGDCPANQALRMLPGRRHDHPVLVFSLEPTLLQAANDLVANGRAKSLQAIVEDALIRLLE